MLEWNSTDNWVYEDDQASENNDEDIVIEPLVEKISLDEAIKAIKISVEWAEQNAVEIQDILSLKKVYEQAIILKAKKKHAQTKITSYFH